MMYVDVQYVGRIAAQLPMFSVKQQNPYLANFRCPLCGDSRKNLNKCRGYLFQKPGGLFYKCHNCGVSIGFSKLLERINPDAHTEYKLDVLKAKGQVKNKQANNNIIKSMQQIAEQSKRRLSVNNLLDKGGAINLTALPDSHPAWVWCNMRKLPQERASELYYTEDIDAIAKLIPYYKDRKPTGTGPRIVIAYYGVDGQLAGISGRAINDNNSSPQFHIRYVTYKLSHDDDSPPLIFNVNAINFNEPIFVTEGPFDSMFLPNSISVGNSALDKAPDYLKSIGHPVDKAVLVFDNQPRNSEVVRQIKKAAKKNYQIVVWPQYVTSKDINEIILEQNFSPDDILHTINTNTFRGPALQVMLQQWSKV